MLPAIGDLIRFVKISDCNHQGWITEHTKYINYIGTLQDILDDTTYIMSIDSTRVIALHIDELEVVYKI